MQIYAAVKHSSKRKPVIHQELLLKENTYTLSGLIAELVKTCVEKYNREGEIVLSVLTVQELQEQAAAGKVAPHFRGGREKADCDKALQCALQGFADGLYRVFLGDGELVRLDESVTLHPGDVLTFIRFTMLAGRLW